MLLYKQLRIAIMLNPGVHVYAMEHLTGPACQADLECFRWQCLFQVAIDILVFLAASYQGVSPRAFTVGHVLRLLQWMPALARGTATISLVLHNMPTVHPHMAVATQGVL